LEYEWYVLNAAQSYLVEPSKESKATPIPWNL